MDQFEEDVRRLEKEHDTLALAREEKVQGERSKARKARDVAKALQAYLRGSRDRLMNEIWVSVMARASAFVTMVTTGDDHIERFYRDPETGYRYVQNGEDFAIEGNASGAQRAAMGAGLQMALTQMGRCSLNMMLFDEPTADMDDTVSAAMALLLSSLPQQTIMVSHREYDGSMAENVITLAR